MIVEGQSGAVSTRVSDRAVDVIVRELDLARRHAAAAVDRCAALVDLLDVASVIEERQNVDRPPRARTALTFDALLDVRGDEETRAKVEALTRRIAPEEEP